MVKHRRDALLFGSLFGSLALTACELLVGIEDRHVTPPLPPTPGVDAGAPAYVPADVNSVTVTPVEDGATDARTSPADVACFQGLERMTAFNSPTRDLSIRFTTDGLGAYLTRAASTAVNYHQSTDVLFASRTAIDVPFGPFSPAAFYRSDAGDSHATLTADGKTVYFDAYQTGSCSWCKHIWRATRPTVDAAWGPAQVVITRPNLEDFEPYVLPNGSAIYYVRQSASSPYEIWRAYSEGGFTNRELVAGDELNVYDRSERAPIVTADDLAIYFGREHPGTPVGAPATYKV